ncbi:hypothetical protein K2173_021319 [Erythroxylum novogranatense]|uniref:Remorin C-terminal domain-containing protein n=1 Tax=Erythroxylum novogranatense TaxID=1862640 RepID=A0AAV8TUW6_9ROSI|nr:hypothetical protein K2173_021319 [Erythroxylum novogranatense]
MKQNLVSSESLGTFPSPGVSSYQDKGWCSERVPRQSRGDRRHIGVLRPFYSGRALPSKWDDAERWICSPVFGYNAATSQSRLQRRPKSKSGPIVPPGVGQYSNCSPSLQIFDGASLKNFMKTPFSTGVLMPNGVAIRYGGVGNDGHATVASLPWSDVVSECSLPSSQDEKLDDVNNEQSLITRDISRRDMATQMSPEGTNHSSTTGSSSPPTNPPELESQKDNTSKMEVREVRVDKRSTMINRWSKRPSCISNKGSAGLKDYKENYRQARKSSWDISDAASDFSKLQREEAKITAWENLQKAKADAAVRKLEMKLEKKRSSSMDKILSKLRSAEMRAEEMRSSILVPNDHQIPKTSHKFPFLHKLAQFRSLSSCFLSDAL